LVFLLPYFQEGHDPKKLDKIFKQFGFPVGAATLADEVGLDVGSHIMDYLVGVFGDRLGGSNPRALREMVAAGFHGRKSGKGIYIYEEGVKERQINPDAEKIIKKYAVEPVVAK
jgi:enoyl-CoA hydratase / long-chain 3-hydroxyacyl-CoA dehydrogenase